MNGMKVKIHFENGYLITEKIPITAYFTKHFQFWELYNPSSGEDINMEIYPWSFEFMQMVEEFRERKYKRTGLTCTVNSGYRTQKFNDSLPNSVKDSGHCKMLSIDIAGTLDEKELDAELKDWQEICNEHSTVGEFFRYKDYIHIGAFIEHYNNPYTDHFYYKDKR